MKIPDHGEDFGQTLALWAWRRAVRDVAFFGAFQSARRFRPGGRYRARSHHLYSFKQHIWWDAGREYFTVLDLRAQTYQTIQGIQRSSVDYYASLRSLYRQLREKEIRNGHPKSRRFAGLLTILSFR